MAADADVEIDDQTKLLPGRLGSMVMLTVAPFDHRGNPHRSAMASVGADPGTQVRGGTNCGALSRLIGRPDRHTQVEPGGLALSGSALA